MNEQRPGVFRETLKNDGTMKKQNNPAPVKLGRNQLDELICMLYRIEQICGHFSHVYHLQKVVNVEKIEAAREAYEKQIDEQ